MCLQRDIKLQKAFTLIELLIVILIVSMVYFLGFSDVDMGKKKPKALTPLNLKKSIVTSELFVGHTTLLCLDKCKTCLLRGDIGSPYHAYANTIDLSDIKAYTVDESDNLAEIQYERYNDKKICLKMDFYSNGSSTQIILENTKGTYYLPAYFDEPKEFKSPEDAKEYWIHNAHLVSDSGEFY
jgi:prepilin-type N-terminal cleavage/methylation domain-containing protein